MESFLPAEEAYAEEVRPLDCPSVVSKPRMRTVVIVQPQIQLDNRGMGDNGWVEFGVAEVVNLGLGGCLTVAGRAKQERAWKKREEERDTYTTVAYHSERRRCRE